MRTLIPAAMAVTCWLGAATADDADVLSKKSDDALFRELSDGLPKDSRRALSARLELEFWHSDGSRSLTRPIRKPVRTRDGSAAEVVFLAVPGRSVPGSDFSMALLIAAGRVIDWTSCWTHNRTARHELLLEDVDGDGSPDVAFRATAGHWGLCDQRQHRLADDERTWLYAYAITDTGFHSIFPNSERELRAKLSYDAARQPVELQVTGLPDSFREREMVACRLSVTNTSGRDLAITPGQFFRAEIDGMYLMTSGPPDKRTLLKAGETVSESFRFCVEGSEDVVKMHWHFVPSQSPKRARAG